jgi:diphosphate--fructose-6-phosphate 1-phosphotransferase
VLFGAVEAAEANGGEVFGFVGGVKGLFKGHMVPLRDVASSYRRRGGVELLGRTQDQLCKSPEDMASILATCKKHGLTGLVLLGGTRTATDAAYLAEYFAAQKAGTSVVLVPCGIENSLLNPFVEATLGFDTAAKTVSQIVANTCTDGASARKYYYFLRCMDGSSTGLECTSHLSLEVALSVRPNIALGTAEIEEKRWTLKDIASQIADVVCLRAHDKKNFGTVVIPETLLAAVPETRALLQELGKCSGRTVESTLPQLSPFSAALFRSLPAYIQEALVKERQSNGVVQLTQIPTEQLLADMVGAELKERKKGKASDLHPAATDAQAEDKSRQYVGSFSAVCQFVGYQARTGMPSDFDSEYGRVLGGTAAMLAAAGHNGYFASVSGLASRPGCWRCAGAPVSAISQSTDQGVRVVPRKVNVQGPAWQAWKKIRADCATGDLYCNPGPVQMSGIGSDSITETLKQTQYQWGMERNYLSTLDQLRSKIAELSDACRPGCETRLARAAGSTLSSMEELLGLMREQSAH